MANKRIKDLSTTAAVTASDDFIAVDGATNGTRKLDAYSPTFGGNLTVSGTGQSSVGGYLSINSALAGSTYGRLISGTTTAGLPAFFSTNAVDASLLIDFPSATVARVRTNSVSEALAFGIGTTERARFTSSSGNFLIGTTTDNTAKLQVYATPATAGYQYGIRLSDNSTTTIALGLQNVAGSSMPFVYGNSALGFGTNGVTALTLDSSQHFKLTPAVASSITTTQSAPQIRMGSRASGRSNVVLDSTAGRVWSLENTGTSLTVGYSGLDAITIAETTGNATFAGSIAIGNTVQTAVAVASTHKVTISIGGSTYYLLATNV